MSIIVGGKKVIDIKYQGKSIKRVMHQGKQIWPDISEPVDNRIIWYEFDGTTEYAYPFSNLPSSATSKYMDPGDWFYKYNNVFFTKKAPTGVFQQQNKVKYCMEMKVLEGDLNNITPQANVIGSSRLMSFGTAPDTYLGMELLKNGNYRFSYMNSGTYKSSNTYAMVIAFICTTTFKFIPISLYYYTL